MFATHKRNLPHFYKTGVNYFITYRLHDSIPTKELTKMRQEFEMELDTLKTKYNHSDLELLKYNLQKNFFGIYDELLHKNSTIQYLKNEQIAEIVGNAMMFYHEKEYFVNCYCIMPNHVHFVFFYYDTATKAISKIMQSIKGFSARKANEILGLSGEFWQHESHDHIVRDNQELERIISYVKMNPVKAGLVTKWEDWKYTFFTT